MSPAGCWHRVPNSRGDLGGHKDFHGQQCFFRPQKKPRGPAAGHVIGDFKPKVSLKTCRQPSEKSKNYPRESKIKADALAGAPNFTSVAPANDKFVSPLVIYFLGGLWVLLSTRLWPKETTKGAAGTAAPTKCPPRQRQSQQEPRGSPGRLKPRGRSPQNPSQDDFSLPRPRVSQFWGSTHLVLRVARADQQQLQRAQVAQPLARRADNFIQEGLAELSEHTAVIEHPGEGKNGVRNAPGGFLRVAW